MLLTFKQMEYLEAVNNHQFKLRKNVPKSKIKMYKELDEAYFFGHNKHLIIDFEEK